MFNTNFWVDKAQKESVHYPCKACTSIDSFMKMERNNYPRVYLRECKYKIKKEKMSQFIDATIELDSNSNSE